MFFIPSLNTPFKIFTSERRPGEASKGNGGKKEKRKGKKRKKIDKTKTPIKRTNQVSRGFSLESVKVNILAIIPPRKTINQTSLKSIKTISVNKTRERNQKTSFLLLKTNPKERNKRIARKTAAL